MSKITELVENICRPVAEEQGVQLWDVEYIREGGERYLRVYIDAPDGIDINQCESFSRVVNPLLDDISELSEQYIFEVSSAGLERELKKPEHFAMFMGQRVEVRLYRAVDGAKRHTGLLTGYEEGGITLDVEGRSVVIPAAALSKVRLSPDFSQYF